MLLMNPRGTAGSFTLDCNPFWWITDAIEIGLDYVRISPKISPPSGMTS